MSTFSAGYETTTVSADGPRPAGRRSWSQRLENNWPVVPMRIFLGALFLFGGYAKFSYPGFFDDNSLSGLKQVMLRSKSGSPIGSALTPIINNGPLFGHITAGAEFAIGAGLVVGALTRIAALGGVVLTTLIALSYNWDTIRVYTATSGWFTSVDIAVAVALTVFVIGGAGPLSIDRFVKYLRDRQEAREAAEPGFAEPDPEASRRRLQAQDDYPTAYVPTAYVPAAPPVYPPPAYAAPYQAPAPTYPPAASTRTPMDAATQQIPPVPAATATAMDTATMGYPPLPSDLEHDEAAEVEPSPLGRVGDASSHSV